MQKDILFLVFAICYLESALSTDSNECLSNPCLNKGTCEDMGNGYQCLCMEQYGGLRCEQYQAQHNWLAIVIICGLSAVLLSITIAVGAVSFRLWQVKKKLGAAKNTKTTTHPHALFDGRHEDENDGTPGNSQIDTTRNIEEEKSFGLNDPPQENKGCHDDECEGAPGNSALDTTKNNEEEESYEGLNDLSRVTVEGVYDAVSGARVTIATEDDDIDDDYVQKDSNYVNAF